MSHQHHDKPAVGHEKVEVNVGLLAVLILLVVSVGGIVQIVPLFFMQDTTEPVDGLTPIRPCNWRAVIFISARAAITVIHR